MLGAGIAAAPPGPRPLAGARRARGRSPSCVRWTWPFGGRAAGQPRHRPGRRPARAGAPRRRRLLLRARRRAGRAGRAPRAVRRGGWRRRLGLLRRGRRRRRRRRWWRPRATPSARAEVALVQGGGQQGTRKTDTSVDRGVRAPRRRHRRWSSRRSTSSCGPRTSSTPTGPSSTIRGPRSSATSPADSDAPMIVGTVEDAGPEHFRNARRARRRRRRGHRTATTRSTACRSASTCRSASLLEPVAGDALPDRDALIGEQPGPPRRARPGRAASPRRSRGRSSSPTARGRAWRTAARLVLNPTNGSSFTGTIVQTQQVASSRMRAIETAAGSPRSRPPASPPSSTTHGNVLERTADQRAGRDPARGRAPRGPDDLHAAAGTSWPRPRAAAHRGRLGDRAARATASRAWHQR